MPYIKREARIDIDKGRPPITPGELNYVITNLCSQYMNMRGEERYFIYNEIVGALECAKLELYRRKIAPYEDKSIEVNGDVYA